MHITKLLRNFLYRGSFVVPKNTVTKKNIMTSPKTMQEMMKELETNPYYNKYEKKIKELQQGNPEEFLSRVGDINKEKKKKFEPPKDNQFSKVLNPKEKLDPNLKLQKEEQSLDKIMKVDLLKDKSSEEIKTIWEEYYSKKEKDCIVATIPSDDFIKLRDNSKQYPTFLFPVPRSQGYEFIMCQFEGNTVHFTPLLYYQVHKENAPECLTITHYTEFLDTKGIVLMRGEYDKNVLNAKEALCLANQLQLFYIQGNEEKKKLLENFNYKPDSFDHMDLVNEVQRLSL